MTRYVWTPSGQDEGNIVGSRLSDLIQERFGLGGFSAAAQRDIALIELLAATGAGWPETPSVHAYGAIGDGTTDDRAAFAAADVDTDKPTYVSPDTYRVGSDLTITNEIVFVQGAKLKPDSGVTVTIAGPLRAGLHQVFDTSAGGTIALGTGATERVLPHWWGAQGDGVTDDTTAIQAAVDAAAATRGIVYLPQGTYRVASTLSFTPIAGAERRGFILCGAATKYRPVGTNEYVGAKIVKDFTGSNLLEVVGTSTSAPIDNVLIEGIHFAGDDSVDTGKMVSLQYVIDSEIRQCHFDHQRCTMVELYNVQDIRFDRCYWRYCGYDTNDDAMVEIYTDVSDPYDINYIHFTDCRWEFPYGQDVRLKGISANKVREIVFDRCKLHGASAAGVVNPDGGANLTPAVPLCTIDQAFDVHWINCIFALAGTVAVKLSNGFWAFLDNVRFTGSRSHNIQLESWTRCEYISGGLAEPDADGMVNIDASSQLNIHPGVAFTDATYDTAQLSGTINGRLTRTGHRHTAGSTETLNCYGQAIEIGRDFTSQQTVVQARSYSENNPRMSLTDQRLQFGPGGASAADVGISRKGVDLIGPDTGDSWHIEGTWDGGRLRLGDYHLWVDTTGDLRIKNGAPTSDTDGTVVGNQT